MSELQWLQMGSVGAGGIFVVLVLDRVVRLVALVVRGRACRRNGGGLPNGSGAPAWRLAELLAQILGTLKEMRHDLARLGEQVAALNGSAGRVGK